MSSSVQVPSAAHYGHNYETKKRLASYWHQVDECLTLGGKTVLVIGKGSGLPSILLERRGFQVTTVDIQSELTPAVLADVRRLPFPDQMFDIATCCEVLEHLPFEYFLPALCEIRRVVRRGLVLSLPDRGNYSKALSYILFSRKVVIDLPNLRLRRWTFDGEHYWEVGTRNYRVSDIQEEIGKAGLLIKHTFRVWEYPYHRFWRITLR